MKTEIKIWSQVGHSPLTKRGGSFCDLLLDTEMDCETPAEAEKLTLQLMAATPHSARANFYMPEYPNQNIRQRWL